jgi:hypothetical protein
VPGGSAFDRGLEAEETGSLASDLHVLDLGIDEADPYVAFA